MHWQMVQSYRDCDVQELQKSAHSCCKGPRLWSIIRQSSSILHDKDDLQTPSPCSHCNNHPTENSCAANCCRAHRHSANLQLSARLILPPNTNMNRITMAHRTGKQLILQLQPLAGGYSMFAFPVVRKLYRYTIGPAVRSVRRERS